LWTTNKNRKKRAIFFHYDAYLSKHGVRLSKVLL
jgi:hypothetical protein